MFRTKACPTSDPRVLRVQGIGWLELEWCKTQALLQQDLKLEKAAMESISESTTLKLLWKKLFQHSQRSVKLQPASPTAALYCSASYSLLGRVFSSQTINNTIHGNCSLLSTILITACIIQFYSLCLTCYISLRYREFAKPRIHQNL